MFDVTELAKGSPEQQQAICEIAARIHKAERQRAALAQIAVAGYEPGADPQAAAAFVIDMNAASNIYEKTYAMAVETAFESLTGSKPSELIDRLQNMLSSRGIIGFAIDRDSGEVVGMTPDGPMDTDEDQAAVLEIAETLLDIPGMVPEEIRDMVEARVAERRAEAGMTGDAEADIEDDVPADADDTSWLAGIDMSSAPSGTRDFDGNVE